MHFFEETAAKERIRQGRRSPFEGEKKTIGGYPLYKKK
jgi:hypothetical protein